MTYTSHLKNRIWVVYRNRSDVVIGESQLGDRPAVSVPPVFIVGDQAALSTRRKLEPD